MHDLSAAGSLSIVESGVNYAVVSGTGTLTGQQYNHTEKIISYQTGVSGVANERIVANATLVSWINSHSTAARVAAFYASAKEVTRSIVYRGTQPGEYVQIKSPLGDVVNGIIKSEKLVVSAVDKAEITVLADYAPSHFGNDFGSVELLTGSGTYTVPAGVNILRVVLIGGGQGGQIGGLGGYGSDTYRYSPLKGGAGGQPGTPGNGGNIYEATLEVTPGQTFSYEIGAGGEGGYLGHPLPDEGSPTTFGSLTSADGMPSAIGYTDLLSGDTYGVPGVAGIPGGAGSGEPAVGPDVDFGGVTYHPGANGADASPQYAERGSLGGGYGGGAAAGSDGGAGANADGTYGAYATGNGGAGANAAPAANGTIYGQGGQGGHGGGGGGSAGRYSQIQFELITNPGVGGSGGYGGKGGDGAPGCILVYH